MQKKKPAQRTLARQLAEHHGRLSWNDVPEAGRQSMKRLLLDYLGVAIAGSQTESGVIARTYAGLQGKGPEATLIGGRARVPVAAASFANAISCHSIELD
ncbi:MAG: MmgE/PrpD family protein, partial [Pseudomonadota bacterium]